MRTLITERELDKMEIESEMVVSAMEEEFDDAFRAGRKKIEDQPAPEVDQRGVE